MGNEVSYARPSSANFEYQSLQPISMPRTGKEKAANNADFARDNQPFGNCSLLKTAFTCLWSIKTPHGMAPIPRYGHFFAFNENSRNAYIGFGVSAAGTLLQDVWCFNIDSQTWTRIHLTGEVPTPRSGASACLLDDTIIVFGGIQNNTLYNDLYTIDINTGQVKMVRTNGYPPPARSDCYMGFHDGKLIVFGGFKSSIYSDLFVLDTQNYEWHEVEITVTWSCQAPHCQYGNYIYSYGGDKGSNLLIINIDDETATISPCIGAAPVQDPINGALVYCNGYLVCFGGKTKNELTLVYALDLETNWWFVLYVSPDQDTTTFSDGQVSNGIFLLPSFHSFSAFYDPVNRYIISFLGVPFMDPPSIFYINVGQSFPIINLRKDMICMYHCK
ncbi:Kelch motif family protein [Trichomonas vaginalis G3]|uniref:Kelch motif family protein n=1 Tax=Trichomonas vaginalis (strain ATCC PRA-98 / G3) TaxID=412133 RepID=A2DJ75_TRIV3|nr:nitrile biosynthetic process [Trichomonas vaginalis G3]EAY19462.1 Kelch motif family protein [Trichomonas vaginalis G3]KAI5520059.1 nitrile biosynthetic process [Trichomonas vaginalis G3]|eukprot:XP_001580448.1 Kelch motif family protein [Trichomonas vaginalis G3]